MAGICFRRENYRWVQDQWSFVFSNFGVTDIWERHFEDDDGKLYQPTIPVETAVDLPDDRPLVVLAPIAGRYIKGQSSIVDFEHPEDAIYLFGGSHLNLSDEEDLGGRVADHYIYIPTVTHELYAPMAGYIVLYDRLTKRGDFG